MVGYNVQAAVDTRRHLIVTHEVTNVGSDRRQLTKMAKQAQATLGTEGLGVMADRGYYRGEERLDCEQAGITAYVPKSLTSTNRAKGQFDREAFRYVAEDDAYECPAGERLIKHMTSEQGGADPACVLDLEMPAVCAEVTLHGWERAADVALGI